MNVIKAIPSLLLLMLLPLSCMAQESFTQRIQKEQPGQGKVTIHQDPAIDQLVNSATLVVTPARGAKATRPAQQGQGNPTRKGDSQSAANASTATAAQPANAASDTEAHGTTVRVMGYRVQAFAGGNSRKDRQQAEQVAAGIRQSYPGVAVSVHFYSPRWICRVGNYRTYEEAHQMLVSLKNKGYTQATIVKGKISVSY